MISNNVLNVSKNYFASHIKTSENSFHCEEQINKNEFYIDTEVSNLSSRKLWKILQLNQIKTCELDQQFILEVKNELIARDDFNNGHAWQDPH